MSTGRTDSPIASARSSSASCTTSSSVRWSSCSSRCRPIEQRITSTPSGLAGGADPVPLGEGERRRLDRPPSTGGTRKPDPCVSGKSRARKASVTIAIEAYSIRASSSAASGTTSASSRPVARGRGGEHHRVGVQHLGVPGRADHEVPAAVGRARQVAHGGAGAHVEARRGDDGLRQPADAADQAREHRHVGRLLQDLGRGPHHRPVPVEQRHDLGHGGARRDLAGVAGVHPAEQRLHQPVDDLAAEALLDQPADADVLAVEAGGRQPALERDPGQPEAERTPLSASARVSAGTPISVRGIGRSRPRDQRFAVVVAGCTIRSPSPAARASATASGRRLSIASAPTSTVTPPTSAQGELAADGSERPPAPRPRRPAPYAGPPPPRPARRCRAPTTTTRGGAAAAGGREEVTGHRLANALVTVDTRAEPEPLGLRHRGTRATYAVATDGRGIVMGTDRRSGTWWRRACSWRSASLTACSGGGDSASDAGGRARDLAAPAPAGGDAGQRRRAAWTASTGRRRAPTAPS